jgi:hypothetical protein
MARALAGLADLPGWLLAVGGVPVLLWSGSAAVSSVLPRRWKRGGAAAFWALLAALLVHAGRYVLQAWAVPREVWLVGAGTGWIVVLLAARDRPRLVVFGLLWLLSLGVAIACLADRFGLAPAVEGGLLLAGLLVFVPTAWVLFRTPLPPTPPPAPAPAAVPPPPQPTLVEQLDSDEAQEGADKYTRE